MDQKQRNIYYDTIKYFLFILVVLIHNPLPGVGGSYMTALARCAVPIYFCISGYFYKSNQPTKKKIYKVVKYMSIYIGMNLFWFVLNYIIAKTPYAELAKWAKMKLSFKGITTCLLFGEAYGNQYLWYLHAIAMVYIAVVFVECLGMREIFSKIALFWVFLFCFFAEGIMIVFGRGVPEYLYRNWLLEGLSFFFLGMFLKKTVFRLSNMLCGVLIALGACLTIVECYALGRLEFYLGSVFVVIGVMLLGKNLQIKCNCFANIGKKCSLNLYLWHPLVAHVLILSEMVIFGRTGICPTVTTVMVIVLTTIITSRNYGKYFAIK